MKYTCPRCDYEADNLDHYKSHINKQKVCIGNDIIPTLDNVIIQQYRCQYCPKKYSDSKSFKKHVENCKQIKLENEVAELKQQVAELKQVLIQTQSVTNVNNGVVNNNVHNGDNNFVINNFANTDIKLTDNEVRQIMRQRENAIKSLVEKIHFDKSRPENHNVYISNYKNNQAFIKKEGKWVSDEGNDIVDNMITDYHNSVFHPWSEKIDIKEGDKELYDIYYESTNNKESEEKMRKDLIKLLHNKKDIVIESKEREMNCKKNSIRNN